MKNNLSNKSDLLSVCLITYNHSSFIKDAIEGVLIQKTDFDFNLVIADDFSTDGTREILLDYKSKYPDKIELLLQSKNVGPARNWLDLVTKPKSKYVAYFEGDDYWIDPYKLQKQVDFLEKNEGYTFHCTRVEAVDVRTNAIRLKPKNWNPGSFNKAKLLLDFDIHTSSFMYRNNIDFRPYFNKIWSGDFFLAYESLMNSDLGYLSNDITSVYRVDNLGGQSFSNPEKRKVLWLGNQLGLKDLLIREENAECQKLIANQILDINKRVFALNYELGLKKETFRYLALIIFKIKPNTYLLKMYLKSILFFITPKFIWSKLKLIR